MHAEKNTFDDEELIEAARGGDERAFARLVERYQAAVFAAIVAIIRDFAGAQDLAQEVFVRAWFGLGGLEDAASFPGWLQTIARNRARSYLAWRRRQPSREELPLDLADSADLPDRSVEKGERRRLVLAALDALPEGSRQVLLLHYIEELNTPAIARQLGIAEATVRQRMRRALQETSESLLGESYWAFWSTVDNLAARQCQNHAWLAGLHSVRGEMAKARQHLRQSLSFLDSDELGEAGIVLKRQFATQMEQMFPVLAEEPEVRELRQEVEAG